MARGTGANAALPHAAARSAQGLAAPAEPSTADRKPRRRQPQPLSSADEQQIAAAYAAGASIATLARQYRVANKRVVAVVVAHGGTVRSSNRPPRPLSSADEERIAAAYAAGGTVRGLAREFRVDDARVVAIVVAHGGERRSRGVSPRPLPAETVAEIVRAYEQERMHTAAIAAQHGIGERRVSRALQEAGVELRHYVLNTPAQLDVDERAELAAAYAAGADTDELKRHYRCGYPTVRAVLAEHGIAVRPSPVSRPKRTEPDELPLSGDGPAA
jgi:Mor family transcriptional regulator